MDNILALKDFSHFMHDFVPYLLQDLLYIQQNDSQFSSQLEALHYHNHIKNILDDIYEELDDMTSEHCCNLYGEDHLQAVYPGYKAALETIMFRTMKNNYLQRLITPIGRYVFNWVYAHACIHFSSKSDCDMEQADDVLQFLDDIDYEWSFSTPETATLHATIEKMARIIGVAVMLLAFDDYLPYTFFMDELGDRLFAGDVCPLPSSPTELYSILLSGKINPVPVLLPSYAPLVSEITFILQRHQR